MQNKNSGKQYFVRDKNTPWYRGQLFSIGLMLLSVALWFIGTSHALGKFNFKPKLLIVRSEGCAYLQLHKIHTKPYPIANTCAAEVPFKYLPFSENGVISVDDDQNDVFVNGSQIVAVEALPDRPWTSEQRRQALIAAIGTLALVAFMTFMLVVS